MVIKTQVKSEPQKAKDDKWVHTICDLCLTHCPAVVHRVDGVAIKIEGDKDGPYGNGQLCAKGFAGLMGLYDPNRVTKPMKRTNPEKGIGTDPKWQEISWDEALDIIAENLKKVREDDPRKLSFATFDSAAAALMQRIWGPAFGTPNTAWQGYYCGNSLHNAIYLTNGTFSSEFDIDNCNYAILQGTQSGFMTGMPANLQAQRMADAIEKEVARAWVDMKELDKKSFTDRVISTDPNDQAFIEGVMDGSILASAQDASKAVQDAIRADPDSTPQVRDQKLYAEVKRITSVFREMEAMKVGVQAIRSGNIASEADQAEALEAIGADVTPLFCESDPTFPNHLQNCGFLPTFLELPYVLRIQFFPA